MLHWVEVDPVEYVTEENDVWFQYFLQDWQAKQATGGRKFPTREKSMEDSCLAMGQSSSEPSASRDPSEETPEATTPTGEEAASEGDEDSNGCPQSLGEGETLNLCHPAKEAKTKSCNLLGACHQSQAKKRGSLKGVEIGT
jgi:hypothetical protein